MKPGCHCAYWRSRQTDALFQNGGQGRLRSIVVSGARAVDRRLIRRLYSVDEFRSDNTCW
jgi:hypothetical protein